jgi:S-adenosylmethionine/arginine decarboxylase-like enzyme
MSGGDAPMQDTDFHTWPADGLLDVEWVRMHARLSDDDLALAVLLGALTPDQAKAARAQREREREAVPT